MKKIKALFILFTLFSGAIKSQFAVPSCPSNLVYVHNTPITAYNPSLPLGPGNPVSTGIPGGGGGLALMPNINAATPNPTFYTILTGGNVGWWNGSTWVNTGHSIGNSIAVNLGGCGCYLYSLVGGTGQVYVYNGTGPGTLLTTLTGFSGGGPYDIVTDANCNFYILKTTNPQSLTMYSPTGSVISTYNMTGMPSTSAGGGFSIIGTQVFVHNINGFFIGNITGSTINFTSTPSGSSSMSGGDYASCPIGALVTNYTANAVVTGTLGCSTTSVSLTANTNLTPVNSYSWTGPGLTGPTNSSVAIGTAPGVYSCTISKTVCPVASTVVTATVVSNGTIISPTISLTNTLTCASPTASLSVTPGPPGYTYTWTGPGITSGNGTATVAINQGGTYTVAVANATNTCQGSQTLSVPTDTTPPTVASTPSGTNICFGQSTSLTASGAVSYLWSTAATTSVINVTPNTTTTYTVVGMAANGCTNTAISTVSVTPLPVPIAGNNGPLCVGANLQLTGSGGTTYAWVGPGGFMNATQNPNIAPVTLAEAGTYTLLVTVGTCTGSTTTSVTINPLPSPTATNNGPVCEGMGLTFNGTGGVFYNWSGPSGFVSNSQTPGILVPSVTNSGTYTLTVTDANGCTNFTTTTAVVNPLPAISISGSTVCANQTINLGATGGTTYNWTGPAGFTSSSQNPSIPNANPSMGGVYSVTVTDVNNCSSTSNTVVVVNPIPTPNANNNSPVCTGQSFALSATGGLTYSWVGPNGFSSTAQNPLINTSTTNMTGTYSVTVYDNIGCGATAVTIVTVNPLPNPSIIANNTFGCAPLCATFTVQNSTALQSVVWSVNGGNGANGNTYENCFNAAGLFTVTAGVTDINGCSNTTAYLVDVYPIPVADFNFAPIKPIVNHDEVTFTDASHSATIASWNWYFYSNATNTSNAQHPTFYYPEAGTYPVTLVVKSDKGCVDTITKIIVVGEDFGIYIPNAFTPNGDGLNDYFQPKGFGIKDYELDIFDRWGERIFHTKVFEEGWDGKYHRGVDYGKFCKDDAYVWKIRVVNVFGEAKYYTGHVTLIK